MGEVWSAWDSEARCEVAVKLLQAWASAEPGLAERFEREGAVLAKLKLKSPHICALIDRGEEYGVSYIALEKLEGETLEQLLQRVHSLSLTEVAQIGGEILQALSVAHGAGIVHRDLSPGNVFLHHAGLQTITKLIDFGVAKTGGPGPGTTSKATMGTLPFIAPEQLGDAGRAGPRADLYAVGTLVFFALTGRLPFGSANGTRLVTMKREMEAPSIDEVTGETWPAALKTFLAKTIARSPAKRYASAEVAAAALQLAARGKKPSLAIPEADESSTATLTRGPRGR
jgi:serine/threonine-protein kinase